MNLKLFLNLLLIFSVTVVHSKPLQGFDKSIFYKVIASGNIEETDKQLSMVSASLLPEKEAFEGVLLMRKAGMVAKAKDKLSLFKSGRLKLESAISKDNNNTEYRFLRLLIQEHAPKIVKYRNKLEEDSQHIRTNFENLSSVLQKVILDYCKKSTVLKVP